MARLVLNSVDDLVFETLKQRADATRRPVEDVAAEALLRGIMQDGPERAAIAAKIRSLTLKSPGPGEDTVSVIRQLRDAE